MVPIANNAKGGEVVDLLVEAAANELLGLQGEVKLKASDLAVFRRDLWHLFHDLTFLFDLAVTLPEGELRRARILRTVNQALNEYANGEEAEVTRARRTLEEQLNKKNGDVTFEVSAVGHAHLDLVWLWPLRETIRKAGRTFSSSLRCMEEYPEYKFAASQPQLYQLVKESYPELFEEIKKAVKAGRWEPLGAMWVEPDCNIPSGESLVRQIYYGKRFYKEEFGFDVDNLWLPDTFGFSPVLPQLMRKSGVKYFMSQKMSWSKTNTFPHHTFEWEGIDGSRVLSHFLPSNTMNSKLLPKELLFGASNFRQKDRCNHWLFSFGEGDGGGGPGKHHLEFARRARDCAGVPRVTQRFVRDFFRLTEEETDDLPRWHGELYLERHRGTLTTCGKTKSYNRRIEILLHDLELVHVINHFLLNIEYPSGDLEAIWKALLLQQFHDILPGTTIHMAFEESARGFEELISKAEASIRRALRSFSLGLYGMGGNASGLILFNTTGFPRRQICRLPREIVGKGEGLFGSDGEPLRLQSGEEEIFLECDLPAYGFINLQRRISSPESVRAQPMRVSDRKMENSLLRLEFGNSGLLERIYDKQEQREVIAEKDQANKLLLFRDVPVGYDAWDIDPYYADEPPEHGKLISTRVKEKGQLCVSILQEWRISKSTITQEIVLYRDSRLIEFKTRVEWREDQRMLKTRFPLRIHSESARFDIQFGNISRPNFKNTSWEQVQYEVLAHKWVDLAESGYGVALLNDCKYGHNACRNDVELTLLRSPVDPDPLRDRGTHSFTYALYPHKGDFREGGVIPASYFLNFPILCLSTSGSPEVGALGAALENRPLVTVDAPNVVLETVKRAELVDAIVLRLYESHGGRGRVELHTQFAVTRAREADLLENDLDDLSVNRGKQESIVVFSVRPYEIKTVKLWIEDGNRIISVS
jgi:alpha-mannosidase